MKKGLGRGFESLIPTDLIDESFDPTADSDSKVSKLQELDISLIEPDPEQPRRTFEQRALDELAESIKNHGIIQPIVVTPNKRKFIIVAGERRWRAAQIVGLEKIPAIVRTLSDQHRLEISLIENLQRRDLNPIETATAYLKLRDQFNLTLEQIGERVGGKSIGAVSNTLRLLRLPKTLQTALFEGKITEGQARPMVGLPVEVAEDILAHVLKEDWSARRIEQWIVTWKRAQKQAAGQPKMQPYEDSLQKMQQRFKAKITISTTIKGSGRIVIPFKDPEDFERIQELLN